MAKEKYFMIRVSDKFKEKVRCLAMLEGMGISEYVTDILKKKVWEAEQKGILPKDFSIDD